MKLYTLIDPKPAEEFKLNVLSVNKLGIEEREEYENDYVITYFVAYNGDEYKNYNNIVGYSTNGIIFLRNQKRYILYNPYSHIGSSHGKFKSIEDFAKSSLEDVNIVKYAFRKEFVEN